jgi:hypothetical protein
MKLDNPIFTHIAYLSIKQPNFAEYAMKLAAKFFDEENLKQKQEKLLEFLDKF